MISDELVVKALPLFSVYIWVVNQFSLSPSPEGKVQDQNKMCSAVYQSSVCLNTLLQSGHFFDILNHFLIHPSKEWLHGSQKTLWFSEKSVQHIAHSELRWVSGSNSVVFSSSISWFENPLELSPMILASICSSYRVRIAIWLPLDSWKPRLQCSVSLHYELGWRELQLSTYQPLLKVG